MAHNPCFRRARAISCTPVGLEYRNDIPSIYSCCNACAYSEALRPRERKRSRLSRPCSPGMSMDQPRIVHFRGQRPCDESGQPYSSSSSSDFDPMSCLARTGPSRRTEHGSRSEGTLLPSASRELNWLSSSRPVLILQNSARACRQCKVPTLARSRRRRPAGHPTNAFDGQRVAVVIRAAGPVSFKKQVKTNARMMPKRRGLNPAW
jgi:hypothetical protein